MKERIFWIVALVSGGLSLTILFTDVKQFFLSYLVAYLFFLGISLGALLISMTRLLVGGRWGAALEPGLVVLTRPLPVLALAFIPLLFGMSVLYPWTDHENWYLNRTGFILRAVIYWITWLGLNFSWQRGNRSKALGAAGVLLAGVTVNFAAIDWVMSLDSHFYSSIFGLLVAMGFWLSAFAVAIARFCWLHPRPAEKGLMRDMGNMLLMSVLVYAYFAFSQYLLIWSGQLPHEIQYYAVRFGGAWRYVAIFSTLFLFFVPFMSLLMRDVKQNPALMIALCGVLILMSWVNLYWQIAPSLFPNLFHIHWGELLLAGAVGGIWGALFIRADARERNREVSHAG